MVKRKSTKGQTTIYKTYTQLKLIDDVGGTKLTTMIQIELRTK
jgi:hypothetical protein